ncbi:PLP-dependent aminotransferase family protein [Oceanotoga sp. DSM 15011]|uniref:MocR-like pyridoxine biosynthesis transcription factor PdxR n=1 Tax=Oceanotoga sp. DSM 15011 TaxID=2984951 RepID=UPI0021F40548|nr:PLP-dependent aminotransferase family protein [Oceanotoga sp. DSM 15011]UYO99447.1 PLP-dependent aminotransferase family protein [Oceanotoga sp. DSM 15011]
MFDYKINKNIDKKLYLQVYESIKKDILTRKIVANTKLPPIRKIASDLKLNPSTIVKAYNLLEEEKLVYKKLGSGSYVAYLDDEMNDSEDYNDLKINERLNSGQINIENNINFASATPSANLFPVEDFKSVLIKVLDRDGGDAFTYQQTQGYYPLRKCISEKLREDCIATNPEKIQIVSGAQQAIDLISRILLNEKDTVVVEEPTYSGAIASFNNRNTNIKSFPIQKDGIDLSEFEKFLNKNNIKLFYTMPTFQNPTGILWSEEKKQKLLELSYKYDFYILEDDCLSELYYDKIKLKSLKSMDKNGKVIYIKSYSKIFMPGLRLGFIILPEDLFNPFVSFKYSSDISSPGLNQRAFEMYLKEGYWAKHIEKMRVLYKKRFEKMYNKIKEIKEFEIFEVPMGGLYFWIKINDNFENLFLKASKRGVSILPGKVFSPEGNIKNFYRLSFADADEQKIEKGMNIIKSIIQDDKNLDLYPIL